ncbi:TnsA endonuclease N-terminal domain-containing protein [Magnetospirillum sp. 15-1]|uniref:TnsA endonuclease N-terminal domain-containing protein n=1 Tax=Magnetospirillum sp. 15-1 TaxID=1979370 RepID=UPI001F5BA120|nr:TnsA endonuclease N-terminal domain-containing protein [Magnetospirillum sp. 15-1]
MPVRKIGLCYRSVSGRVPMGQGRPGVQVESTLERDFALLCRFDPSVAGIEEQPVRIEYDDADGRARSYVPDFLVTYRSGRPVPRLVEIKYSTDPMLTSGQLDGRFAAARTYARRQGWRFQVMSELEIRTPRLENATFLLPFRGRPVAAGLREALRSVLRKGGPKNVASLADEMAEALGLSRPEVLPGIWTLVAEFQVAADLDCPLTMNTFVTPAKEKRP